MKVLIVGAGPAGLALAYLLKKSDPKHSIRVIERHKINESVGSGITLSPLSLKDLDYELNLHKELRVTSISYEGQNYLETPVKIIAIARDALLKFLREQCFSIGVDLQYNNQLKNLADVNLSSFDLIVGADGVNSLIRKSFSEYFCPTLVRSTLKHAWLATSKLFGQRLVNMFQASNGVLLNAWAYQYSDSLASFILECTSSGLKKSGLEGLSHSATCNRIAHIFENELEGHPVIAATDFRWNSFKLLKNKSWHYQNVVIIGDAAHTTHFSKGYGTVLAICDAICLTKHLITNSNISAALQSFEKERRPEIELHQSRSASSLKWYETVLRLYESGSTSAVIDAIILTQRDIDFSDLKLH
ncbi:MAG TPA: FAD-dependent monooxygenase [Acidobacteriota bacterium]|nr:FAD-dependent monooxygenase [Acidobacteriota bacterium]